MSHPQCLKLEFPQNSWVKNVLVPKIYFSVLSLSNAIEKLRIAFCCNVTENTCDLKKSRDEKVMADMKFLQCYFRN